MNAIKKQLFVNGLKNRVPLTATIELNGNCNFRCLHCYIDKDERKSMLSFDDVVEFGEQVISMGCLYIILTGGEVLLHPDFERIYLYFIKRGMIVSVFTNGSLINTETIDLFVHYPPKVVEITMYGASENSYLCVTKSNSYTDVKNNILALKENSINVVLKMFVLRENAHDFEDISQFALSNNIVFKYDTMILADTSTKEYSHQLSNSDVLKYEHLNSSTVAKADEDLFEIVFNSRPNKLFQCGAGRIACWLKCNYHLRICNFLGNIEFDMRTMSFRQAWDEIGRIIEQDMPQDSPCSKCQYKKYCDFCPAKSNIFTGSQEMKDNMKIFCDIARYRYNHIEGKCSK